MLTGNRPNCSGEGGTPKCRHHCEGNKTLSYHKDKHYGHDAYSLPNNVHAIQLEIMRNGPVEAAFEVYADFPTYKSGKDFVEVCSVIQTALFSTLTRKNSS